MKAIFLIVPALVGLNVPACRAAAPDRREERAKIGQRANERFARANFCKPRESELTGVEAAFLPLIVEEVAGPAGSRDERSSQTVYERISRVDIGGATLDQVTYLWLYPDIRAETATCEGFRGVRITLGGDGFPLVWEALSDGERTRLIFVAEALEQEAQKEFGAPASPERFTIEKTDADLACAVVVGTVEQGPVPMGPYVYLSAAPEREITTILCRCSPSQVDAFTDTRHYDVQPLETIALKCPQLMKSLDAVRLDTVLRWPATVK